ncbi:MAG: TrkA family potassium uptake protein [Actinomycetota bacterium]|nr:TrkA family potassium uptake protein [Actinomycetota bacterium]
MRGGRGAASLARILKAFFRLPGMRGFTALIAVFVLAVVAAVVDLSVVYENPETGGELDTWEAIYAVFTLFFFGGSYPWPEDAATRVLFFMVPLLGFAVIGQGLLGLLSTFFNRDKWEVAMASTFEKHVIVCGLGRVGFRVLSWLTRLGEDVVLIESREDHALLEVARSWKVPVIIADARRREVLEQAGIMRATSIVPCTNDDLVNLTVATAARALRPDIRVVIRTFDDTLATNLEKGFDIHFAYSTSALAAPAFAAAAMRAPVDYAFPFGKNQMLLTICEFTAVEGSEVVGYTIGRLEEEFDVEVLAVEDTQVRLNPPDDTVITQDHHFVVSASLDAIRRLSDVVPATRELDRFLRRQDQAASVKP